MLSIAVPKTYTVAGAMTLIDSGVAGSETACYGTGGYDDMCADTAVTVRNQSGEVVATTHLLG